MQAQKNIYSFQERKQRIQRCQTCEFYHRKKGTQFGICTHEKGNTEAVPWEQPCPRREPSGFKLETNVQKYLFIVFTSVVFQIAGLIIGTIAGVFIYSTTIRENMLGSFAGLSKAITVLFLLSIAIIFSVTLATKVVRRYKKTNYEFWDYAFLIWLSGFIFMFLGFLLWASLFVVFIGIYILIQIFAVALFGNRNWIMSDLALIFELLGQLAGLILGIRTVIQQAKNSKREVKW
jgi:hypothetical protein